MDPTLRELRSRVTRAEELLAAVSSCLRRLAGTADWEEHASVTLETLGQAADASRAYLFRNGQDPDGTVVSTPAYEWTAEGVRPHRRSRRMDRIPVVGAGFARWAVLMEAGEVVEGPVHRFPEGERRMLQRRNIRSVLVVPVAVEGCWWGFLGLDDCRTERVWSAAERDALQGVSAGLGVAISRQWAGRSLEDRERARGLVQRVISGHAGSLEGEFRIVGPSREQRLVRGAAKAMREGSTVAGVHGLSRDITDEGRRGEHVRRTRQVVNESGQPARKNPDDRPTHSEVDLNEVAQYAFRVRRHAHETQSIRMESSLAGDLPRTRGDQGRLVQVVLNLLVNAERAVQEIPMGRRIEVRTFRNGAHAVLEVHDNGPGIPAEHHERIFDPTRTARGPRPGIGPGLSLCLGIVADHGGTIQVESGTGRGTRFAIRLPMMEHGEPTGATAPVAGRAPAEPQGAPQRASPSTSAGSRGRQLLVVDDEPGIRQLLRTHLERQGHRVVVASDGEEALRRVRQTAAPFDLVISDLRMPGIDGEELFRRITRNHPDGARHLAVMTGDVTHPAVDRIVKELGAEVIGKPFDLRAVDALINRLLGPG